MVTAAQEFLFSIKRNVLFFTQKRGDKVGGVNNETCGEIVVKSQIYNNEKAFFPSR